jgi:exodeoxyribonuclease V alpha subunit
MEETVAGVLTKIIFHNTEDSYTVAVLDSAEPPGLCTVSGNLARPTLGEYLRLKGYWEQKNGYGRQFVFQSYELVLPQDKNSVIKFLEIAAIKGLGKATISKIVEQLGAATLEVIEKTPEKLLRIKGLTPDKIRELRAYVQKNGAKRQTLLRLHQLGFDFTIAHKILQNYGDRTLEIIASDPYQVALSISGVGFRMADQVAAQLGGAQAGLSRIKGGINHCLQTHLKQGHTCFPLALLLQQAAQLLELPEAEIEKALLELTEQKVFRTHESRLANGKAITFVFLPQCYNAETKIAEKIAEKIKAWASKGALAPSENLEEKVSALEQEWRLELAPEQREAILRSCRLPFHLITGGPGTGKSAITRFWVRLFQQSSEKIVLAAPTGKAAKRLSEIAGIEAFTLHRLLEYNPALKRFMRNDQNPLTLSRLLIDECSMLDTLTFAAVLKALPPQAQLILMGDADQLPSVGPGAILKDIIESKAAPVTFLTQVFRQAKDSQIISAAHAIKNGIIPSLKNEKNGDFFFIPEEDANRIPSLILELVAERLPARYGFSPLKEIQVLAPQKRGVIGAENLNRVLQEKLNPLSEPNRHPLLRLGDKVMQIKNNYELDVFNGDTGYIIQLNPKQISVDFEGRVVTYPATSWNELMLAYAVSVHKYQGSESPCVVMPIHPLHSTMLHRSLIYTALTRGKQLVVFVGSPFAFKSGIQNIRQNDRYTQLSAFLQCGL